MNFLEFQNSKIELAKSVLDIKNEALLRKIQKCLLEEEPEVIRSKPNYRKRQEMPTERSSGIEDVKGARQISSDNFVIKLS